MSGIPIGLALTMLSSTVYLVLALIIFLEHGHFLSPLALAWGHIGFRKVMRQRPVQYIGVPIVIVLAATTIGILTSLYANLHIDIGLKVRAHNASDYRQPFVMMAVFYWLWNSYHFAMQSFGVLSIYRGKSGSGYRRLDMAFCLFVQAAVSFLVLAPHLGLQRDIVQDIYLALGLVGVLVMTLFENRPSPRILFILTNAAGLVLIFWSGIWGFAIYAINHWLVAIGLSSHVYANNRGRSAAVFVTGLIAAGMSVFWLVYGSGVNIQTLLDPQFVVHTTIIAISLRYGFAFTHFLYDRWLWQLSNPEVRSTIGGDLFESPLERTSTYAR
jgi:hypothetical protein